MRSRRSRGLLSNVNIGGIVITNSAHFSHIVSVTGTTGRLPVIRTFTSNTRILIVNDS